MTEKLKLMPEAELKAMAEIISEKITIRTWYRLGRNGEHIPAESGSGSSEDTPRGTTPEEAKIIFNAAYGALLAINWNREHPETFQAIRDTAEFIVRLSFNDFHCNAYDTIYIPLDRMIDSWEKAD